MTQSANIDKDIKDLEEKIVQGGQVSPCPKRAGRCLAVPSVSAHQVQRQRCSRTGRH